MSRGKYIVLEGAQGVGKSTIASMVMHELQQLGIPARTMHEPDGKADATTKEIRRLTQDPKYPMNTRTEVLLYNAARSQSLEAVRAARYATSGDIVHRGPQLPYHAGQSSFMAEMTYIDYQRLNDIVSFAVGDMWPDLTVVLDAPVQMLHERVRQRGETERFDSLDAAMLERIRAGYLWEARQRNLPIVYATGRVDEVFRDVWQHIETTLDINTTATSEPVAVADLLAKSPAAKALQSKQASIEKTRVTTSYFIPQTLPDDIQCDYCDEIERIVGARRKLVGQLAHHLRTDDPAQHNDADAQKKALAILKPLLPVACTGESLRALIDTAERLELSSDVTGRLPAGFASSTETVQLTGCTPRNELDLLPAMLYESLDLPINEVKSTVAQWPYEVKSTLFQEYLRRYPTGKALAAAQYEWDFLTELTTLQDMPEALRATARLQLLTPRYGYTIPQEVEDAGLTDEYDDIFDQSLQLQSTLQARGYTAESQYATLLGHKQRWSLSSGYRDLTVIATNQSAPYTTKLAALLSEKHPLLEQSGRKQSNGS
jgi:dTMP kinase